MISPTKHLQGVGLVQNRVVERDNECHTTDAQTQTDRHADQHHQHEHSKGQHIN
jgi:hypothetical protein